MKILALNSDSSSQKSALYKIPGILPKHLLPHLFGKAKSNGLIITLTSRRHGAQLKDRVKVASRSNAIEQLLDTLWNGKLRVVSAPSEIDVVGHRIVHGGQELEGATVITPEVKSAIARMSVFAPLHNRAELSAFISSGSNMRKVGSFPFPFPPTGLVFALHANF
jgi:acetate kinase